MSAKMGGLWSLGSGLHPIASFSYRYTFSLAKSSGKGILNIGMELLFIIYQSLALTILVM